MKTDLRPLLMMILTLPMHADPTQAGGDLLAEATDAFFDESRSPQKIAALLDEADALFSQIDDPCQRSYLRARAEYLHGFVERAAEREKEAKSRFESALALAQRALECEGSSEAHRMVADSRAQLIASNGVFYAMRHGPQILGHAQAAVALDRRNAKARLTLALSYLNAPRIANGSVEKAIAELHGMESLPMTREEQFGVFTWLGIAYEKAGDTGRSREYLGRAGEVYPGNSWIPDLLGE